MLADETCATVADSVCGDAVCSLMCGKLFLSKDTQDSDLKGSFIQRESSPLVACDVACVSCVGLSCLSVSLHYKDELHVCLGERERDRGRGREREERKSLREREVR